MYRRVVYNVNEPSLQCRLYINITKLLKRELPKLHAWKRFVSAVLFLSAIAQDKRAKNAVVLHPSLKVAAFLHFTAKNPTSKNTPAPVLTNWNLGSISYRIPASV